MEILTLIISILVNIYPPTAFAPDNSLFICDNIPLEARIYNNQIGSFKLVNQKEELDAGSFVVLNWGERNLMLPRTFNLGETSFTDGKWWWSYSDSGEPVLRLKEANNRIIDFDCSVKKVTE